MKAITPATRAGPPIKRSAPGWQITGAANLRSKALYQTPVVVQACFPWECEAAKLLNEHLTSGRENHCQAFKQRHVTGMVKRAGYPIALTLNLSLHSKRDSAEAQDAVKIQGVQLELNLVYDTDK